MTNDNFPRHFLRYTKILLNSPSQSIAHSPRSLTSTLEYNQPISPPRTLWERICYKLAPLAKIMCHIFQLDSSDNLRNDTKLPQKLREKKNLMLFISPLKEWTENYKYRRRCRVQWTVRQYFLVYCTTIENYVNPKNTSGPSVGNVPEGIFIRLPVAPMAFCLSSFSTNTH